MKRNKGLSLIEVLVAVAVVAFCLTPLLTVQSGEVRSLSLLKEELLIGNFLDDITDLLADAPNSPQISSLFRDEKPATSAATSATSAATSTSSPASPPKKLTLQLPEGVSLRALRYPNLATGAFEPKFDKTYNDVINKYAPKLTASLELNVNNQAHLNRLHVELSWRSQNGSVKKRALSRLLYGAVISGPAAGACIPFRATN